MCEHHSHEDQPLGPLGQLTGLIYVQTARLAPRDILVRKVRWVVRAVIIDPALKSLSTTATPGRRCISPAARWSTSNGT